MNKNDFLNDNLEYIGSLKASGEKLTREEWIEWIKKEAKDYKEEITEEDIKFILKELEEDGYILEGED